MTIGEGMCLFANKKEMVTKGKYLKLSLLFVLTPLIIKVASLKCGYAGLLQHRSNLGR